MFSYQKCKEFCSLSVIEGKNLPSLAYRACIHNGLRRQCSGAPHKQRVRCSRQVSSSLYPSPGLSISCHGSAHQPAAYITKLSARLLMRLGSSPSIILVSLPPLRKYFGSEKQRKLGNDGSQSSISSCAWTQTSQEHRFCLTWRDVWEQGP